MNLHQQSDDWDYDYDKVVIEEIEYGLVPFV